MPASTAMLTDVVNDSTSTTTKHPASCASYLAPVGPHSNRARCLYCRNQPLMVVESGTAWATEEGSPSVQTDQ